MNMIQKYRLYKQIKNSNMNGITRDDTSDKHTYELDWTLDKRYNVHCVYHKLYKCYTAFVSDNGTKQHIACFNGRRARHVFNRAMMCFIFNRNEKSK